VVAEVGFVEAVVAVAARAAGPPSLGRLDYEMPATISRNQLGTRRGRRPAAIVGRPPTQQIGLFWAEPAIEARDVPKEALANERMELPGVARNHEVSEVSAGVDDVALVERELEAREDWSRFERIKELMRPNQLASFVLEETQRLQVVEQFFAHRFKAC